METSYHTAQPEFPIPFNYYLVKVNKMIKSSKWVQLLVDPVPHALACQIQHVILFFSLLL